MWERHLLLLVAAVGVFLASCFAAVAAEAGGPDDGKLRIIVGTRCGNTVSGLD